jgi:hypothetical protein
MMYICRFQIVNYSHVEYGSPLSLTKSCLNYASYFLTRQIILYTEIMPNQDFFKVLHLYRAMVGVEIVVMFKLITKSSLQVKVSSHVLCH